MKKNYNIDKHLQKSLQQMSVTPADSSFARMMEKLDQKKKRRRFIIFIYSGIGGIAALLCVFYGIALNSSEIRKEKYTEIKSRAIQIKNLEKTTEQKNVEPLTNLSDRTSQNHEAVSNDQNNSALSNNKSKDKSDSVENVRDASGSHELSVAKSKSNHRPIEVPKPEVVITVPETYKRNDQGVITSTNVEGDSLAAAINVFYLPVVYPLIVDNTPEDLALLNSKASREFKIDSLKKKPKCVRFMLGIYGNPQYSDYVFAENKNRAPIFDSLYNKAFRKHYLENKREVSKTYLTYCYGIKAGILLKEKWEILLGAGIQRLKYLEKSIPFRNFNTAPTMGYYSSFIYKTIYYSADLRRIVQIRPFLKMNFGAGIRFNRGYYSVEEKRVAKQEVVTPASNFNPGSGYVIYGEDPHKTPEWDCRVDLKAGVIYDLGKRFQLRFSPGIFYTPTSMVNKTYLIKQKAYGAELECLLVFKFN